MEKDNKNAYSEVIEILKLLDDEEKLEAMPIEMLEVLKSKANPEYKPQILKDIPLEEQNLQPETLSILSWIAMKYWKEEPENMLGTEDTAKQETENINEEIENNCNLPMLHKDLKWYQKVKEKILEFFHKIFKSRKEEGNAI